MSFAYHQNKINILGVLFGVKEYTGKPGEPIAPGYLLNRVQHSAISVFYRLFISPH